MGGAWGSVGLGMRLVVDDVIGFDAGVRKVIAAKNAHGPGTDDTAGKAAAFVSHPGVASDQRAVFFGTDFHAQVTTRRWPGSFKDLAPLHRDLDGPAAFA